MDCIDLAKTLTDSRLPIESVRSWCGYDLSGVREICRELHLKSVLSEQVRFLKPFGRVHHLNPFDRNYPADSILPLL
jgi:hypothetical protein